MYKYIPHMWDALGESQPSSTLRVYTKMGRLHLFEWHDFHWFPNILRIFVTDFLHLMWVQPILGVLKAPYQYVTPMLASKSPHIQPSRTAGCAARKGPASKVLGEGYQVSTSRPNDRRGWPGDDYRRLHCSSHCSFLYSGRDEANRTYIHMQNPSYVCMVCVCIYQSDI